MLASVAGAPPPALGAAGDAVVILQSGVNGCGGVRTNDGSENTTMVLDSTFASNFDPGGTVGYILDYPVTATDVSGRTTFVITDCVFVDDRAIAQYTVSFVPNTEAFQLRFAVPIPADTPLGAQFCNYAKTTAATSAASKSNRKAGPECFTVGGSLRIEKRDSAGVSLAGASFDVSCAPPAVVAGVAQAPTIITGLSQQSQSNSNGTVTASGTSAGSIAISGPSSTPCTVTETAAPAGYVVDGTPRSLVIPVGTAQTVSVFTNARAVGTLVVNKTTEGGTGTFVFDVDCDGTDFDRDLTITGSGTQSITGIPTGTRCTVTERANALFTKVVVPADGAVTIGAAPATVAFTNTANLTSITLDKKVNGGDHATAGDALVVHAGDRLSYTVTVQNSGALEVTMVALADSLEPGFAAACPQGVGSTLAPGASFTCSYRSVATGSATNVAAAVGVDGLSRRSSASDSTFVKVLNPAITIVKTADRPSVGENEVVTFSYLVTNTGDTPLRNVGVTDDILGGIGVIGDLPPGASATLTRSQTVTGSTPTRNIGTATGDDPLGRRVTASDTEDITIVLGVVFKLPVELPVELPVQAPVQAPVQVPVQVPVRAPVQAPVELPFELPRTGGSVNLMAIAGIALLGAGLALTVGGRSRRQQT